MSLSNRESGKREGGDEKAKRGAGGQVGQQAGIFRVAILKYEKLVKFATENSQQIFKKSHKLATFYMHFFMEKQKNHKLNSLV
jgi:hypothetical protein